MLAHSDLILSPDWSVASGASDDAEDEWQTRRLYPLQQLHPSRNCLLAGRLPPLTLQAGFSRFASSRTPRLDPAGHQPLTQHLNPCKARSGEGRRRPPHSRSPRGGSSRSNPQLGIYQPPAFPPDTRDRSR